MFVTRLISGIVLVAAALLTITLNGPVLYFTLLVLSLIGMFELYRATGIRREKDNALTLTAYAGATVYYIVMYAGLSDFYLIALTGALIALLFVYVFTYPAYDATQVMTAYFGIIYVAVCLSYIFQTRNLPDGRWEVWLIFICAWGCDTLAYCAGRLFGKHKMAPALSPKKTIEGAVGGVAGAAVLGGIYAACVGRFLVGTGNKIVIYSLICAVGALISMAGDLAASAIKRNHGVKDYGKLIPGHGGVLDRFDSIIITAPVIYFLALIFG